MWYCYAMKNSENLTEMLKQAHLSAICNTNAYTKILLNQTDLFCPYSQTAIHILKDGSVPQNHTVA